MKSFRLLVYLAAASLAFGAGATTHLLHSPALSRTQIVFSYAGDLWTVSRQGGTAIRLTAGMGIETLPAFSPDGETLAFTGEYDGNIDVFTMPAAGGMPKRITYHPERRSRGRLDARRQAHSVPFQSREFFPLHAALYGLDRWRVAGSAAAAHGLHRRLFAGRQAHGLCALWMAASSAARRSVSSPGNAIAAAKPATSGSSIFADLSTEKIPRTDSNDINPMWIGDKIYFLSDRNGPMTLFRYDPATKAVTELIKNTGQRYPIRQRRAGRHRLRAVRPDRNLRLGSAEDACRADRNRGRP